METKFITFRLGGFMEDYILANSVKQEYDLYILNERFNNFYSNSSPNVKQIVKKYLEDNKIVKDNPELVTLFSKYIHGFSI